MSDNALLLRKFTALLDEAETEERIALAKLSEARRDKAHWASRIADLKGEETPEYAQVFRHRQGLETELVRGATFLNTDRG